MDESLARILMQVSVYSILLPLALAIARIRSNVREQRMLSILVFLSAFTEFAALVIGQGLHLNNLPLLHIFTILEFGLLAGIFRDHLQPTVRPGQLYGLIAGFTIFAILNSIFNESILQFNAVARGVESILIILLVLLYFYVTLKTLKVSRLESSPLFWISSGLLIYFSAGLFVFIYSNYVLESQQASFTVWGIHTFMSIVRNLFFAVALWVKPKD